MIVIVILNVSHERKDEHVITVVVESNGAKDDGDLPPDRPTEKKRKIGVSY